MLPLSLSDLDQILQYLKALPVEFQFGRQQL
jgi:hypothetical protein